MKKEYLIIVEKGKNNLSAYVPDLPGCIGTAATEKDLLKLMEEGIQHHISDMRKRGYRIPSPKAKAFKIETAA